MLGKISKFWSKYQAWIKASGGSVTFIVNPFHWRKFPWKEDDAVEWPRGYNYSGITFGWLFLIIRVWIDDDTF